MVVAGYNMHSFVGALFDRFDFTTGRCSGRCTLVDLLLRLREFSLVLCCVADKAFVQDYLKLIDSFFAKWLGGLASIGLNNIA